jgi:hypothetical protein
MVVLAVTVRYKKLNIKIMNYVVDIKKELTYRQTDVQIED